MLHLPVPDPGPPGPFATMPWLRATVSRFANGPDHERRRALVEARLATLAPEALAAAARAAGADTLAPEDRTATAWAASAGADPLEREVAASPAVPAVRAAPAGPAPATDHAASTAHVQPPAATRPAVPPDFAGIPRPYLPVAVLAAATGVHDVPAAVDAVRIVAAAYHPGTDAPGADEALAALLDRLPPDEPEALAQHVALLVQACEATAGLVRGDNLPVKTTKRVTEDGTIIAVEAHRQAVR